MTDKLDDYYEQLSKHRGNWSGYYYGVFSNVIKENNFKTCAEVGIGYGFHAREILDNTSVEKLFLIDPTTYYPNDGFAEDIIKYGGFENLVKNIKIHLKEYESRYQWFRSPSLNITNEQIPDGILDAVFIDAEHSYDAVIKDLEFWWKKVKIGGWILGDDYDSCWPETKKAVDDFTQKYNLKIEFLTKTDSVKLGYPIYKFIKTVEL